jgi:hypothetical protein
MVSRQCFLTGLIDEVLRCMSQSRSRGRKLDPGIAFIK